jgi:ferredoxin
VRAPTEQQPIRVAHDLEVMLDRLAAKSKIIEGRTSSPAATPFTDDRVIGRQTLAPQIETTGTTHPYGHLPEESMPLPILPMPGRFLERACATMAVTYGSRSISGGKMKFGLDLGCSVFGKVSSISAFGKVGWISSFGQAALRPVLVKAGWICPTLLVLTTTAWTQDGESGEAMGFFDVWLLSRVWVSAIFCLIGLALLVKAWVSHRVRLVFLPVIFFVFGVLWVLPLGWFTWGLGPHPSPLCATTKPFLFADVGYPVPVVFFAILAAFAILSVVGNKLFCGWVCPIGALQEVCHRIPLPEKLKVKLPFRVTNVIRILLFVAFLAIVIFAGVSIYDYANPFEMLHWSYDLWALVALALTLAAGVLIFRPFCYLICPLGLMTWVLEHISLVKVKIDENACTDCDICLDESPCPAVPSILDGRLSRPDCHACGRCVESCPEGALRFRL